MTSSTAEMLVILDEKGAATDASAAESDTPICVARTSAAAHPNRFQSVGPAPARRAPLVPFRRTYVGGAQCATVVGAVAAHARRVVECLQILPVASDRYR